MSVIIIKRKIVFIDLMHVFLAKEYDPNLAKKKMVVYVYSKTPVPNSKMYPIR